MNTLTCSTCGDVRPVCEYRKTSRNPPQCPRCQKKAGAARLQEAKRQPRLATNRQVEYLKRLGYTGDTGELTRRHASIAINRLLTEQHCANLAPNTNPQWAVTNPTPAPDWKLQDSRRIATP